MCSVAGGRVWFVRCLPKGFHRIRHYGMLANASHATSLRLAKNLLAVPIEINTKNDNDQAVTLDSPYLCRKCQTSMIVVACFEHDYQSRAPPVLEHRCHQIMSPLIEQTRSP